MSETKYQYAKVTMDGEHWGLINKIGEYVVAPEYVTIHEWREGLLRLTKKKSEVNFQGGHWVNQYNGQVYFIDCEGEAINSNPYDYGLDFREGMAAVVKDVQWGFILTDGSVAIEFCYEMAYGFREGLSAAKHNDKWGFIGKKGAWVIEPVYDSVQSFAHGLAVVRSGRTNHVINKSGDIVTQTPEDYPWVVIKSKSIILYGTTSQDIGMRHYGFMDAGGNILTAPIFYVESEYQFDLFDYSDGMLIVSNEEDKYGYLNELGQLAIPCRYDYAEPFVNDHALVTLNDRKYIIDKRGEISEITELEYPYDEVQTSHEGLAGVRKGDKWGFINQEGVEIIDLVYYGYPPHKERLPEGVYLAEVFPKFNCGLLPIIKSDGNQYRSGFIDKSGKEVIACEFMLVSGFMELN
ncbi:MAG: WG repeat-containing protein [Cyclobacteriaceae bacterium]